MAKKRGRRAYFQVLLGEHRAELLEKEAAKHDMKAMHLMREFIYEGLQRATSKSSYSQAEAEDMVTWKESIANRVRGRQQASDDYE